MAAKKLARIKQSPKRPAEQRRRELLDAARLLFMKNGYRETSMDHIAREAGLTKGALYFHFTSKEDILSQLVQSLHHEVISKILELPRRKASPVDVLRILLQAQSDLGSAPFDRFLDFWLQAAKISRIKKSFCTSFDDFHKAFTEVLDPRYAASRRDRHDLGVIVLVTAEGLAARKMMGDPSINFPRQLKLFAALFGDKKTATKRD